MEEAVVKKAIYLLFEPESFKDLKNLSVNILLWRFGIDKCVFHCYSIYRIGLYYG